MKKGVLITFILSVLLITSCKKDEVDSSIDEDKKESPIKDIKFLDVSSYTDWVYFSFSEEKVVEIEDYTNSLDWDIAFHRGDIRTNGGTSGIGKAEALDTGLKDWDKVTTIPEDGYKKDEIGIVTIAFTGSGPEEEEQSFSQVLTSWLTIDTSTPPPVYTLTKSIFVIKTADGKYVKALFYDNRDAKNKNGAISFKYEFLE